MPALASLPVIVGKPFYYNVREIPPQSDKPGMTPQIAPQTRIVKAFTVRRRYRKSHMHIHGNTRSPFSVRAMGHRQVSNPTGYYVVLSNASKRADAPARGFSPLVIAPKQRDAGGDASELGHCLC